jgi:hypothetical protein
VPQIFRLSFSKLATFSFAARIAEVENGAARCCLHVKQRYADGVCVGVLVLRRSIDRSNLAIRRMMVVLNGYDHNTWEEELSTF